MGDDFVVAFGLAIVRNEKYVVVSGVFVSNLVYFLRRIQVGDSWKRLHSSSLNLILFLVAVLELP